MKTKNNKRDKKWLQNPDQMKHPKIFSVKMLRRKDGSFHILGGETEAFISKNQYRVDSVKIDTRDFASVLRNSRITSF